MIGPMRLRTLIEADLAIFAIAAVVFVALLPENFDRGDDVSQVYVAAYWIGVGAFVAFVVLLLIAAVRKLGRSS
jgi:Mn2+/Fe2+ NRAMP family transporter